MKICMLIDNHALIQTRIEVTYCFMGFKNLVVEPVLTFFWVLWHNISVNIQPLYWRRLIEDCQAIKANGQKLIRKFIDGRNVPFFKFGSSLAKTVVQKKRYLPERLKQLTRPSECCCALDNKLRKNVVNKFAVALLICKTRSPAVAKIADCTGCQFQGHPRSIICRLFEGQYATSY